MLAKYCYCFLFIICNYLYYRFPYIHSIFTSMFSYLRHLVFVSSNKCTFVKTIRTLPSFIWRKSASCHQNSRSTQRNPQDGKGIILNNIQYNIMLNVITSFSCTRIPAVKTFSLNLSLDPPTHPLFLLLLFHYVNWNALRC